MTTAENNSPLLTPAEARAFLNVGKTLFYRLHRNPLFPSRVRLGQSHARGIRYLRDDLVKFILAIQAQEAK